MINGNKLIEMLKYSERYNEAVPKWVYNMIDAMIAESTKEEEVKEPDDIWEQIERWR